jgi:hypothetical protein
MDNPRKDVFHTLISPALAECAERGYRDILDTNSTYFDYDTEIDEDWYALDFVRGSPGLRTTRQRQGRGAARQGQSRRQGRAASP